ncbi:MAG: ATP synthase epsilon chain [Wolbachia endosymbiont of Ctenocephalides orientis wCori]|nr:MAG: ATP synthase epsilon chain [Wolbachia endosymbiont of Ctenocephalides orientis wCori]
MNTFRVQFLSPDNQILFDDVLSLAIYGLDGQLMILSNHAPYFIYLLPGIVTVKTSNKEKKIVIDNGILEVINNNCSILVNQVQVFDQRIHNEQSFKDKRLSVQLSY